MQPLPLQTLMVHKTPMMEMDTALTLQVQPLEQGTEVESTWVLRPAPISLISKF